MAPQPLSLSLSRPSLFHSPLFLAVAVIGLWKNPHCLLAMSSLALLRRSLHLATRQASSSSSSSSASSRLNLTRQFSSSSTPSFAYARNAVDSGIEEERFRDCAVGLAFGSVSGLLLASGVGYALRSAFPSSLAHDSSVSSSTVIESVVVQEGLERESDVRDRKPVFLFGDAYRRKVFFNYEKRLRLRSSPEKVFEYFASYETSEGESLMRPADLMRAVVPVFPPSDSDLVREGYLRGERDPGELCCSPSTFFMLFDTDNDGMISFAEYIFFVTLLSIPESSFSVAFKMFDIDNDGEIDKEEFKKVIELMRAHHRQGAHHHDGLRVGMKVGTSVEDGGLLEFFFGKDGKSHLQYGKFVEFLRDLHNEISRLEFSHYDYKGRGTISATDFALSMVASADMSHLSKFLDRVDELNNEPHLKDIRITLEEFKAFAELRKQLRPLSLAIFSFGKVHGSLSKEDFKRAASHVCGVFLPEKMIDIIFYVFDTNGDGNLSTNEFVKVIERRENDIAHPTSETGLMGMITCMFKCAKNCSFNQLLF